MSACSELPSSAGSLLGPACGLRNVISLSLPEERDSYVVYDLSLPAGEELVEFSKVPELTSSRTHIFLSFYINKLKL